MAIANFFALQKNTIGESIKMNLSSTPSEAFCNLLEFGTQMHCTLCLWADTGVFKTA